VGYKQADENFRTIVSVVDFPKGKKIEKACLNIFNYVDLTVSMEGYAVKS
jgi:hypothetical protein